MSPRLFFQVMSVEARKGLTYRVDFWVTVLGGLLSGIAIPYFLWQAVFALRAEGDQIGGYGMSGLVAYAVAATLLSKVVRGSDLPMTVSTDIYEGGLNRYLLYPTGYLPLKYAQSLGSAIPNLIQLIGFGLLFGLILAPPPEIHLEPISIAMASASLAVAHLLYFMLGYPLQLVSFWADNVWSLMVLLRFTTNLLGGALLPLSLFPGAWQELVMWTPFPTLFSIPIQTLLGQLSVKEWGLHLGIGLVWAGVIYGVSHGIWRRGMLRYSGVGDLMLRYARLYLHFLRFSFSRAMEFRLDFFFRIVMDCTFYLVNLAFFAILYQHVDTLGGLSEDDIYVFVSGYLFLDGVHMTIFSNNMWYLPQLINKGELDYYLVRPVATLFFVSVREFAANSFLNLLIAAGILGWAIARHPMEFSATRIALHVGLLLAGTFLYWVVHMLHVIPVFWLHRGEGLRLLFFGMGAFSERPHPIFTGWVGRTLRTVLPYSLLVSFPTYYLLGKGGLEFPLHQLTVTVIAFVVMVLFWNRGLRAYSSASS